MNADRQSAGTGRDVVSAECPLPPFVEPSVGIEGQWMSRQDGAALQRVESRRFHHELEFAVADFKVGRFA